MPIKKKQKAFVQYHINIFGGGNGIRQLMKVLTTCDEFIIIVQGCSCYTINLTYIVFCQAVQTGQAAVRLSSVFDCQACKLLYKKEEFQLGEF